MTRTFAVLCVAALMLPTAAESAAKKVAAPTLETINGAAFKVVKGREMSPVLIRAQVMLDRLHFSPGVIDGYGGDNFARALAAFEKTRGLVEDGRLDTEAWNKLIEGSPDPAVIEYRLAAEDVKGPFIDRLPDRFEDLAKLKRVPYASPEERIAERFHMDLDLLRVLNPGRRFDQVGETVLVANVAMADFKPDEIKAAMLEVDKERRQVRVLAKDGALLAVYPASIGSREKPAPTGTYAVRTIAENPTYTYNPAYAFKGVQAKEVLTIQPGPNNPVGTIWIDLTAETFGIHGAPEPAEVGKTASHGCVRLTNWDVEELARMVEKGTKVVFQEQASTSRMSESR